jgi:hypothetical protein
MVENHIGVIRRILAQASEAVKSSTQILSHMLWDRGYPGAADHYMLWSGPVVRTGQPFERALAEAAARFADASRFWS